jgi:hypothetical protein
MAGWLQGCPEAEIVSAMLKVKMSPTTRAMGAAVSARRLDEGMVNTV